MDVDVDDTDLSSILFVECVLQKSRDNFSMFDLSPLERGENAHATTTVCSGGRLLAAILMCGWAVVRGRLSRCPVSFLEQHKAFNTHVCKLIMVILQRGKAPSLRTHVLILSSLLLSPPTLVGCRLHGTLSTLKSLSPPLMIALL